MNFYLPAGFKAGDTMLTVDGNAYLSENADGTGKSSDITVNFDGNGGVLKPGDEMILIDAGTLVTGDTPVTITGRQGSSLDYVLDTLEKDEDFMLIVQDVKASGDSKALSEGFSSGLVLAAQGGDLVAGEGLGNAAGATAAFERGFGFASFAAVSAASLRYNTGSHVDVDGFSLMTGLAYGANLAGGRMTLGAFFEYGNGSYDTYNSFAGAAVNGGGDSYYLGGGLLGRMDFADSGFGRFYAEASARAGRINNEFNRSAVLAG